MTPNLFMQKNPFMSAWLSAANSSIGAGRGLWMAQVQRQQTAMMAEFSKQVMKFWTGAWMTQLANAPATSAPGIAELPSIAEVSGASTPEPAPKKAAAALRAPVARRAAGPAKRKAPKAR